MLATNGGSATVTCEAVEFPGSLHYWVLLGSETNQVAGIGKTLPLDQILFGDSGDRYQCIVQSPYGNIASDIVEIIGRLTLQL